MKKENFFEQYRSQCEKCNHGKKVVIPANDPDNGQFSNKIDILFINERPGPLAIRTGIISFKNPGSTAQRFKRLFEKTFGSKYRKNIFITNAVLWYPKAENYKNKTPTLSEIKSGSDILLDQIEKIRPSLIVSIGNIALRALKIIYESEQLQNYRLSQNIGKLIDDTNPLIYPVYHTASRAISTRSEKQQEKDWHAIKKIIKKC